MWRRASSHLQTLVTWRSALNINRSVVAGHRTLRNRAFISGSSPSAFQKTVRLFSSDSASMKKSVEDVMPIATGHEREELEAELQGRKVVDIDNFEGPFGTKESPAIIKSYFDKRITGCPGGEGEDEHDVVWFWLEKGKPHECPVCGQYFELEVVGPGGPPDGHGDDDHHH